ncbi:MAG: bifunctional nuclease family protein [Salibacteraceae bacterium]
MGSAKIKLDILGLSYSQTQTGAYALVLGEVDGKRRLPIIIGNFEAQAIAIELEQMKPSRPLTHDLFQSFAQAYNASVAEVLIYKLEEGIFFAQLICEKDGTKVEIDARTSDAIALAVRFQCPIYTYESILSSAGIVLDDDEITTASSDDESTEIEVKTAEDGTLSGLNKDQLKEELDKALASENYERATLIRDELNRRK